MKELYTGKLYWPSTTRNFVQSEKLQEHIETDCAVIGGGISGSLCSLYVARSGMSTVLLERGEIAGGSTAISTCLVQFCNDIMLCDLMEQIGEQDAKLFYRSCGKAINTLEALVKTLPFEIEFARRSSLYFASTEQELPKLRREFQTLRDTGFDVEFWESDDIAAHFPFRKPGAIVAHGDAESNPVQLVHSLAEAGRQAGLKLYSHTDIIKHDELEGGSHLLRTADGFTIRARHVVYAIGYEPEQLKGTLIKAAQINRSFAAVTDVAPQLDDYWYNRMLIWETNRPYLYLRTTVDGRIIIGGLDEEIGVPIHNPAERHKLTEKLQQHLHRLFPNVQTNIQYEWSAVFGESLDNLPFIGSDPYRPGVYYCLGYGGNGTVYSMLGAEIIRDLILGQNNPLTPIVRMNRPVHRAVAHSQ